MEGRSTNVRELTDADMEKAAALTAEVFRFAYADAYPDRDDFERFVSAKFTSANFKAEMAEDSVRCLVGEVGGRIAGVLKLAMTNAPSYVGSSAVELARLYVHEEFHGSDIARELLEVAQDSAARMGYETMWLCVWERNDRARAFYRKAGFQDVGEIVIPMNDVPFLDIVMQRALTRA